MLQGVQEQGNSQHMYPRASSQSLGHDSVLNKLSTSLSSTFKFEKHALESFSKVGMHMDQPGNSAKMQSAVQ